MLARLFSFFAPPTVSAEPRPLPGPGDPRPPKPSSALPLYPPDDGRFVTIASEELLHRHSDLIAAIGQSMGMNAEHTQQLVIQPIHRWAEHVLNLPATPDKFYAGSGGLLRLSLDMALFAGRQAQNSEFSGLGQIERRRREAPRWRLGCLHAGLLHDAFRCATDCIVADSCGRTWAPLVEPLEQFAAKSGAAWLAVSWRTRPDGRSDMGWNVHLAERILGPDVFAFLHQGDPDVLSQFQAVISGMGDQHVGNLIHPIVEGVRSKLIARDLAANPMRFAKRSVGTVLGPYFADTLRQLVVQGRWTWNTPQSRIWIGSDGIFLVWPLAAKELQSNLSALNVNGVPRDPHTLVEMLSDAGLIRSFTGGADHASMLWPITLSGEREVSALMLSSPDILWPSGDVPESSDVVVRRPAGTPMSGEKPSKASTATKSQSKHSPSDDATVTTSAAPTLSKSKATSPTSAVSKSPQDVAFEELVQLMPGHAGEVLRKLRRDCAKPSSAGKASWRVRPDHRLEVDDTYFTKAGFDPAAIARLWQSAGVVDGKANQLFLSSEQVPRQQVVLISRKAAELLVPVGRDLFDTNPEPTAAASPIPDSAAEATDGDA